jgi:hypothetical protein
MVKGARQSLEQTPVFYKGLLWNGIHLQRWVHQINLKASQKRSQRNAKFEARWSHWIRRYNSEKQFMGKYGSLQGQS